MRPTTSNSSDMNSDNTADMHSKNDSQDIICCGNCWETPAIKSHALRLWAAFTSALRAAFPEAAFTGTSAVAKTYLLVQ